jgi:very-short-patch-repair endonuclease
MKDFELDKFLYIFSHWYRVDQDADVKISELQQFFISKIPEIPDITFKKLLQHFKILHMKGPHAINNDLINCFLDRFQNLTDYDTKIVLGKEISGFKDVFKKFSIPMEKYFKEFFNEKSIQGATRVQFFGLMKIFEEVSKDCMNQVEAEELQNIFEERIEKELTKYNIDEKLSCLFFLLSIQLKTETLIRMVENTVFPNLNIVQITEFSKIMSLYENRNLRDYFYLIHKIYKPMFLHFLEKAEYFNPIHLQNYFNNWKKVSSSQGMYCDERLYDKLHLLMEKHKDLKPKIDIGSKTYLTILSISNFAGSTLGREVAEKVVKRLEPVIPSLNTNVFIPLAYEVSMNPGISKFFWEYYNENFSKIWNNTNRKSFFYGIYLNLKLQDPESFEIVKGQYEKYFTEVQYHWDQLKTIRKANLIKSKFHKNIEDLLVSMKIDFKSEFYDEYFIDIACPNQKLAIEILGPGHHIYPEGTLNGKTKNKKRNLEKLGWNYLGIPFNSKADNLKYIRGTILSKLALQPNN